MACEGGLRAALFFDCRICSRGCTPPRLDWGGALDYADAKVTEYDGITDDLLSAGLNLAGLLSAAPPGFADPLNPTPAELRRRAIYGNYRGIVDPVAAGGMGLLWGPGAPGAPAFDPPVQAGLIPVPNLHSRAYYAHNQQEERGESRLSYIEVTTGQHFDAFISFFFGADGAVQFAPLHHYFVLAMDSMYAHLTAGASLPPSQVVRPTPRGFAAYTAANVPVLLPPPVLAPAAGDRITFSDGVLTIPE